MLATVIVLAGALRFFHLGSNSLWIDEVLTAQGLQDGLAGATRAALYDNNVPPIYFWLVHVIRVGLGESEFSLRLLSAISGTLTVPAFFALMHRLGADATASMLSAFLLAVHPLHIWFSQEARPYALCLLFGMGALNLLVAALQENRIGQWLGAGLFAYLSFLSHLVGLAVLATGWGWVILRHRRVPVIARLAVFSVILAVLAAPWVVVLAQRADVSHPPARGLTLLDAPYALFTYVGGYSLGPGLRDLQNLGALGAVRANLPETILAVSILCGLGAVAVQARFAAPVHLWILLVVPILFTLAGAVLSDFPFNVRYTLLALPGFLGLIGCLVGTLRPLLRGVALCVIVGTFLLADFQWFAVQRYWKEDSRGAVGWLREHVAPGARVAVVPDYMTLPLAYYASRAGFDATFAGLAGRADLHIGPPATGLVVTREHHVAEPRLIESEFALVAGGHVVTGAVPGYRLFAAARDARRSRVTQKCPPDLDESELHNSVATLQLID